MIHSACDPGIIRNLGSRVGSTKCARAMRSLGDEVARAKVVMENDCRTKVARANADRELCRRRLILGIIGQ